MSQTDITTYEYPLWFYAYTYVTNNVGRSQTELLIIVGNKKDFSIVLDKFEEPRKGEGAKAQELKVPLFRKENKNPIRL